MLSVPHGTQERFHCHSNGFRYHPDRQPKRFRVVHLPDLRYKNLHRGLDNQRNRPAPFWPDVQPDVEALG